MKDISLMIGVGFVFVILIMAALTLGAMFMESFEDVRAKRQARRLREDRFAK